MPFVFRQEGDTTNPTLARVYGPDQSTRGRVMLWEREGDRHKFILFLAQGGEYGCDGINEYHYNGILIPEFTAGHDGDEDFRNWKFHPGTRSTGYDDPLQGRPAFFPELNKTYSFKCYLEVKLPAEHSPDVDAVPDGSEVFMRGLRVMHYDLVDDLLEETTPAISANNALVGLDILRHVGKLPLSRFQRWAQSWKDYEARCDELIEWDKGADHGGLVEIPRFEANVAFAGSLSYVAGFQTVIDRSPGVYWQDVNGGIRILPDPDRDPVHTFNSFNIVRKGLVLTPPDPDTLFNYFLFLYRDIDDVDLDTGQLLYRQRPIEVDLSTLRDANEGILNQFGPFDLGGGPMHKSLAERIAWYIVRNLTAINAERDMTDDPIFPTQFEVKGQMDSFHLAKADYAEISDHYIVGLQTPLCRVLKEVTHPKRGERSFTLQTTSRTAYRDIDHTPIDQQDVTFAIVTSPPIPQAIVGDPYSFRFRGAGGTRPYSWAVSSGSLPGGLSLDADTGELSGTPTADGTFAFTIELTDDAAATVTKAF
jgi:hypothetical protein